MRRLVPFVLAAAAFAVPLWAQTADEVIAKNVAARGGLEKVKAVQSLRMTGTIGIGPGMQAPLVLEIKRGGRLRSEVTVDGKVGVQTFDGTAGWALMPFMGQTEAQALPAEAVKDAQEQSDLDGPLVDYQKKGHKVELVGKDRAAGVDAYRLRVTLKSGSVRDIWIDAASWLEIRGESSRSMGGRVMESETTLGDYRDVGGLKLPHRVEGGPKGRSEKQAIVLSKIEVDPVIDDARFGKPTPATPPADKTL
jgi:outer membrane lipoprotein-sorting protein